MFGWRGEMDLPPFSERSPAVAKTYLVTLADEERQDLKHLLSAGRRSAPRWANWRSFKGAATVPSAACSTTRTPAAPEGAVGHPARPERRVRGPHGGRAGGVPPAVRRAATPRLLGRGAGATGR